MEYQLNAPMIDPRWIKFNKRKRNYCILCLPGRGNHGIELAKVYKKIGLEALIIGVTPTARCWYPMPNGMGDQEAAIAGLEPAVNAVERIVAKIGERYGIAKRDIVLAGYSAGAVVGLLTAMYSKTPFACVVSHSGAILDTDMVPKCQFEECPILLTHSRDDIIFDWNERYIPMLEVLQNNDYPVYTVTEPDFGHGISSRQFMITKRFIESIFKDENYTSGVISGRETTPSQENS